MSRKDFSQGRYITFPHLCRYFLLLNDEISRFFFLFLESLSLNSLEIRDFPFEFFPDLNFFPPMLQPRGDDPWTWNVDGRAGKRICPSQDRKKGFSSAIRLRRLPHPWTLPPRSPHLDLNTVSNFHSFFFLFDTVVRIA